jgi:hypothetical protein
MDGTTSDNRSIRRRTESVQVDVGNIASCTGVPTALRPTADVSRPPAGRKRPSRLNGDLYARSRDLRCWWPSRQCWPGVEGRSYAPMYAIQRMWKLFLNRSFVELSVRFRPLIDAR